MLFIGHKYVAHERTLRGQERNGEFDRFTMPIFTIFALIRDTFDNFVLLVKKAELCTQTEVTYTKETHLFKDIFAC